MKITGFLAATGGTILSTLLVLQSVHLQAAPAGDPPAQAKMLTIPNAGPVAALAFSPDGTVLASAGSAIGLWDPRTGKEVQRFPLPGKGNRPRLLLGHRIIFSADGRFLVVAVQGPEAQSEPPQYPGTALHLLSLATGKSLRSIETATHPAISPDGKLLAYFVPRCKGHPQSRFYLQEFASGKPVGDWADLHRNQPFPENAAFAPDGRSLAVQRWRFTSLCQADSGKEIACLEIARERDPSICHAASIAFAPDGKSLSWARGATGIHRWDPASGKELQHVPLHSEKDQFVLGMSLSKDAKLAATCVAKRSDQGDWLCSFHLWDAATGKQIRLLGSAETIAQHPRSALAFAPAGDTLAATFIDRILVWDLAGRQP
jgi:WD40 repeat protein